MIDLDTIEYYEYMREQEEKEDRIFKKVMDIHLEEESKIILEDIRKNEEVKRGQKPPYLYCRSWYLKSHYYEDLAT